MRNVVQSFKKVLDYAPASHAASTKISFVATVGTDSVAAGQTGVTDTAVPTGSMIHTIIFQVSIANLVNIACFNWWNIQLLRANQTVVNPRVTGGNPQRNQVFKQSLKVIGQSQNRDYYVAFKIPKKYQRVREGDSWVFLNECDQIWTDSCKIIYKFYR